LTRIAQESVYVDPIRNGTGPFALTIDYRNDAKRVALARQRLLPLGSRMYSTTNLSKPIPFARRARRVIFYSNALRILPCGTLRSFSFGNFTTLAAKLARLSQLAAGIGVNSAGYDILSSPRGGFELANVILDNSL
jgi:hypothetical protein